MPAPDAALPSAVDGLNRRATLLGLGATVLTAAGCSNTIDVPSLDLDYSSTGSVRPQISIDAAVTRPELMYASLTDDGFQVPEVPFKKIDDSVRKDFALAVNLVGEFSEFDESASGFDRDHGSELATFEREVSGEHSGKHATEG